MGLASDKEDNLLLINEDIVSSQMSSQVPTLTFDLPQACQSQIWAHISIPVYSWTLKTALLSLSY